MALINGIIAIGSPASRSEPSIVQLAADISWYKQHNINA